MDKTCTFHCEWYKKIIINGKQIKNEAGYVANWNVKML